MCQCSSASLIRKPSVTVLTGAVALVQRVHTFISAGVCSSGPALCACRLTCTNLTACVPRLCPVCVRQVHGAVQLLGSRGSGQKKMAHLVPGFIVNGQIFSIGSLPLLPPTLAFYVVFFELFPHSLTYKKRVILLFLIILKHSKISVSAQLPWYLYALSNPSARPSFLDCISIQCILWNSCCAALPHSLW